MTEEQARRIESLKQKLVRGEMDIDAYTNEVAQVLAINTGSGAIAQGGGDALGRGAVKSDAVYGDVNTGKQIEAGEGAQIIYAEEGATIVIGDAPVAMPAVDRKSALGRYLQHVISQNRYLQLQGIRSGGKLVNIELDRIYITLRATRQRAQRGDVSWLADEKAMAPGERLRHDGELPADTTHITVNEAMAEHTRLVVLGDPGSGKTTLLRYLALLYAQDLAGNSRLVFKKVRLDERSILPIFMPLRQIGRYLSEHHPNDDGTEGHAILLHFFIQVLKNERIDVPNDFFDEWLNGGKAVILLDGLDEVADPALRRRVSRLVDAFVRAYPACRYVVTSRIVGYTDASQLTEGFATTTVRDFTMDDVKSFLSQWHRLVAIGQWGPGKSAKTLAANQTRQLLDSIEKKDRVRELAINPLMLTVIAMIHRDRVKLPDHRAELYAEAVDVLLGKWDEARGMQETLLIGGRPFDISDRRLVLQQIALSMHEQAIKEIDAEPLRALLARQLHGAVDDQRDLDAAVTRFLSVIQERTGLLIARAEGTYAFSHLTFQEYLTALAIAGRDDYIDYTLQRTGNEWWREVILLEAGYLSTQSKEKTTRLIRAIANAKSEPAMYHNLVLAAESVRDAGANRIVGDLEKTLRNKLLQAISDQPKFNKRTHQVLGKVFNRKALTDSIEVWKNRRLSVVEALGGIGGKLFWKQPYGEPEWIRVPAGKFMMGEAGNTRTVYVQEFLISSVPITKAQYRLFIQATNHDPMRLFNSQFTSTKEDTHPIGNVTWFDAHAYCGWLSTVTDLSISLPTEIEWEKAARGDSDTRSYPWGNVFNLTCCNTKDSGWGYTSPVGIFPNGASPYGCLDMSGNVWEWTYSIKKSDPSTMDDWLHVESEYRDGERFLCGGYYGSPQKDASCTSRVAIGPSTKNDGLGFRVVIRSNSLF